ESAICDREELARQAELFSESDLVRFFHSLAETETNLRTATQPRYQLEIGLVKLMEMRRLEPMSELLDRLSELEESIRSGKPPAKPLASSVQSRNLGSNPTSVPTNPVAGSSGTQSSHAAAAATKAVLAPEYEVTSAVT